MLLLLVSFRWDRKIGCYSSQQWRWVNGKYGSDKVEGPSTVKSTGQMEKCVVRWSNLGGVFSIVPVSWT